MSRTRFSARTICRAGIVLVAIVPLTWSLWVTFAADRTWTGGGVGHPIPSQRNLWTNSLNWSSGIAPSAGDSLFFPQGTLQPTSNNDFPAGTTFNSMTVSTGNLLLGNGVVLNAGLTC